MKLKNFLSQITHQGETLAYFGQARLVKQLDGRLELFGGSNDDQIAAREWISMFLHEAVVREVPGR